MLSLKEEYEKGLKERAEEQHINIDDLAGMDFYESFLSLSEAIKEWIETYDDSIVIVADKNGVKLLNITYDM